MTSILKCAAMEGFKGELPGIHEFDLNKYTVIELYPYITFPIDGEIKKTHYALRLTVKENGSNKRLSFFCKTVKIENT
jgi:hypothetical protein